MAASTQFCSRRAPRRWPRDVLPCVYISVVISKEEAHCELITVPGPARSAEIEFLKTGVLPHPTDQQFVTIYAPGSVRGPISDPYDVPTGPSAGDMSGIE